MSTYFCKAGRNSNPRIEDIVRSYCCCGVLLTTPDNLKEDPHVLTLRTQKDYKITTRLDICCDGAFFSFQQKLTRVSPTRSVKTQKFRNCDIFLQGEIVKDEEMEGSVRHAVSIITITLCITSIILLALALGIFSAFQ